MGIGDTGIGESCGIILSPADKSTELTGVPESPRTSRAGRLTGLASESQVKMLIKSQQVCSVFTQVRAQTPAS